MDMEQHGSRPVLPEMPAAIAAVRQLCDGFKAFQALRAGLRSGLFDWLESNGPAARPEIAAALNLRGAHLGGFLQALEDLGLLTRQEAAYRIAPGLDAVLCKSSPWCQAEAVDSLLEPANGWSALDRFLSTDWIAAPPSPIPPAQHPFSGEANRLAAYLADRFKDRPIRNILCFDGGNGLFAATAGRYFPEVRITAIVRPEALPRAQEILAQGGLPKRCHLLSGTPLNPPTQEQFDLAVLFHALYPVRQATNDALAAVTARLAPGGELHCAHWFCLESCETAPGGLRDLDKAVLTDSHPMCHVETFCLRFEKIGLIDAQRDDLVGEYGITKLHFAVRPDNTTES